MSTDGFDVDRPWQVDARVSMRPEPFGALLYHFGTRRLSFLKNQRVLAVVRSLADHPSARAACAAAGVPDAELPVYARALAAGAESVRAPADQPYGDRMSGVKDPFGYKWWIATHIKDVSPEEMQK